MSSTTRTRDIVLALGGGGVRGLAHLGVLAEFERAGIAVSAIAGTSSGALMGALWLLYGAQPAIAKVRSFVSAASDHHLPDLQGTTSRGRKRTLGRLRHAAVLLRTMLVGPPVSRGQLIERISALLPPIPVESLPVPLRVVCTASDSGEEVWLDRGFLPIAVAASSAMPGLAAPLDVGGMRLQDGGAVAEVPVRAARALGSPVVAVEVSEALPYLGPDGDRIPASLFRAAAMGWQELRRRTLAEADAVIAPAINHIHWADYSALDEAVDAGGAAARAFLDPGRGAVA
jgi:NTE family protein